MWQLVILSVEYYEHVSMAMYLQPNLERKTGIQIVSHSL